MDYYLKKLDTLTLIINTKYISKEVIYGKTS